MLTLSTCVSACIFVAIGALCAFSLLSLLSFVRCAFWRRRACARSGGWGRRSRLGGAQVARAVAEMVKRRLGVRADQQALIDPAFIDMQASLQGLREAITATRAPVADLLRAETVDETALAAIFALHDEALARARRELVSAVKQVHAVLDVDQRKKAADLLASVA